MKNIFSLLVASLLLAAGAAAQITPNMPGNPAPAPGTVNYGATGLINYSTATTTLRNYTRETVPQQPYSTLSGVNTSSLFWNGIVSTQYTDGLGRPLQEVRRRGVTNANTDLVSVHVYDEYGREAYQCAPYPNSNSASMGKMKTTPFTDFSAFYGSSYPGEEPYGKTLFDNSPLNRVVKSMAPGKSWVGSAIGTNIWYHVNTNTNNFVNNNQVDYNILKYSIAHNDIHDIPTANGYYGPGELYLNKTQDEDGNTTLKYTNKDGQTLAVMNYMQAPENNSIKYFHVTYYIYDDYGRLRFVTSPEAMEAYPATSSNYGTIATDVADGLCYKFWYNEKGLLTQKKLPGKEVEYFVYDKKNRLVLSQDGKQRADNNKWLFTVLDAQNRPLMTGMALSGLSQAQWENLFLTDNYTNYTNQQLNYFLLKYDLYNEYENSVLWDADIYTKNFYDDYSNPILSSYSFNGSELVDLTGVAPYAQPTVQGGLIKGLLTGSQTRVMNSNPIQWLTTVYFYNNRGQIIQQQSNQVRGSDRITNQYDFSGGIVSSVLVHHDQQILPGPLGGSQTIPYDVKIVKKFTKNYNTGAVTKLEQNINNTGFRTIFQNTYDQLSRVSNKNQSAADNNYNYNVRGWLTGINAADIDATSPVNKFFFEQLSYDHGFDDIKLNGNISGITWKNAGTAAKKRMYGYTYDNINRLKHAEFAEYNPPGAIPAPTWTKTAVDFTVSNLNYDHNGNITSMNQRGPDGNPTPQPGNMDQLSYSYATHSNQLMAVSDAGITNTNTPDFKNGINSGNDYEYDFNGSLTKDLNKGIAQISYSYLNKPEHIDIPGKGTIDYVYDATGTKLQKTVVDQTVSPAVTKITEYVGPFVYEDGNIQNILHEEGRCRPVDVSAPDGSYLYDYFIKDHLGNVRTTINAEATSMGPYLYNTGLEISLANTESIDWNHLDAGRNIKPDGNSGDVMAAEMNASVPDQMIGPAIMLRVMPGDQFAISAETYFDAVGTSNANNEGDLMNAVLGALTAGTNYSNVPVTELDDNLQILQNTVGNPANVGRFGTVLSYVPVDSNAPQSYVAYLFFDNNNELVKNKSVIMPFGSVASQWNTIGTASNLTVDEPGYISVFAFTRTNSATHIDHFSVDYYKGNVLEMEDHYYPFGLTLTSPATNVNEQNKYKYNGKEIQHNEFAGGGGLDWYDYGARMDDPQTGRWFQIDPLSEQFCSWSPYSYCFDNPANLIDPDGMAAGNPTTTVTTTLNKKHLIVTQTTSTTLSNETASDGTTTTISRVMTASNDISNSSTEGTKSGDVTTNVIKAVSKTVDGKTSTTYETLTSSTTSQSSSGEDLSPLNNSTAYCENFRNTYGEQINESLIKFADKTGTALQAGMSAIPMPFLSSATFKIAGAVGLAFSGSTFVPMSRAAVLNDNTPINLNPKIWGGGTSTALDGRTYRNEPTPGVQKAQHFIYDWTIGITDQIRNLMK